MASANNLQGLAPEERRKAANQRVRGCLVGLLAVCAFIPIFAVVLYGLDALVDAPWAYPWFGHSTLTGIWEGEFTTRSGDHFALLIDLGRKVTSEGSPQTEELEGALLAGQAQWCDSKGRRQDNIDIHGSVPSLQGYDGTAGGVEIDLESAKNPPQGLLPDTFEGRWNGDTLILETKFLYWNGSAFVYSSTNPDLTAPLTVTLKRADEGVFRTACEKLRVS